MSVDTARRVHLNVNCLTAGAHSAAWRSPGGNPHASIDITHYQRVAQEAERGLLDAVFLADSVVLKGNVRNGPSFTIDPAVLVTGMALATSHVGFVASVSTTFNHPYHIARIFASLDHASEGRVAWNVVTTRDRDAGKNYGFEDLPTRRDRYARADEAVEVVTKLWDSWEDEALIADPGSAIFADPSLIHAIDHEGDFYSVRGPLQVPRSPQGRPLMVQAGGSDGGLELAARFADAHFTAQHELVRAQAYYKDLKARVAANGRDPEAFFVLPGLNPIVGGTEAEAKERQRSLDALVPEDQLLSGFAGFFGLDPGELDLDRPFPEHLLRPTGDTYGSQGFDDAIRVLIASKKMTVRELIAHGTAHRTFAGAPEQIADTIEHWFTSRAADGFNLQCDVYPEGLSAFVDYVIPELQRRGLFRREYEGTTLRESFGLQRPVSQYESALVATGSAG